jgi:poly-gamma-glutamate capsule biosynthesis protein CapA/YwtB (metallophosphatase superfamily)
MADSPSELHLLLVGDVMLGRGVNDVLLEKDAAYPWGDTRALFLGADWRACNLECVISDRGEPWEPDLKAFHFRSDLKNLAVLQNARIDAVTLANNHSLDFGHQALSDCVQALDVAGIRHAGAGADLAAARALAVSKVKGRTIGVLAFTDNEPDWEAKPSRAGIWYCPVDLDDERAADLLGEVGKARKAADIVVISAHWGPNWGYDPPRAHRKFAHALIDHGADVIFGHSGHVFRGVEIYRGRPILYCAGNFIDDYAVDEVERNDESFIFVLDMDDSMRRIRLYPTVIHDCQARIAGAARAQIIASKMQTLCGKLGTDTQWNARQRLLQIEVAPR